jgi:hypothetical protein
MFWSGPADIDNKFGLLRECERRMKLQGVDLVMDIPIRFSEVEFDLISRD